MYFLKDLSEIDLDKIRKEIEDERRLIRDIKEGRIEVKKDELMKVILFIVESPNKARTIASFFGRPSIRNLNGIPVYEISLGNLHLIITASRGHILELTTENIGLFGIEKNEKLLIPYYTTIKRCLECNNQFTEYKDGKCPYCGSSNIDDSINRIKALQELAQEVDQIVIGTDPDTEGEMIAYSLFLVLNPYNNNIKRAEFHEVTKNSIINAINNLRDINLNLVKSQIVRRIEDRWIGFSLSSIVQNYYNKLWLSAGRVQTPILGWIINRFNERNKSKVYILDITLENDRKLYIDTDFKTRKEVNKAIKELKDNNIYIIDYKEYEEKLEPLPPYITSTILQDANNLLKIGADKIMQILQELFESSLITYHRTDSTRISSFGISLAKEYINQKFGEKYFYPRSWGEGGAHEAIRPTKPLDSQKLKESIENGDIEIYINMTRRHYIVYDLIFARFIQSQMKYTIVNKYIQKIRIPYIEKEIELSGIKDVKEDGWNLVYPFRINVLKINPIQNNLKIKDIYGKKVPKLRLFSQADIINLMKEKDIGRPSTYATIIKKVMGRGYVIDKSNNLIPTKLGIEVYLFLEKYFHDFVSEKRTRDLEDIMDRISEGREDYMKILNELFNETNSIVETGKKILNK
ncbi:reverse gyrase [Nanobdella aerobiophila]|uniref:Reverse gyrase n=1 Tax=Nanobdella aerobiophila TaxID=2586965 RepID=A0A915SCY1_9ARCH|nr:reverse gyrase [Nanobdella aerobiophila]BBL45763.1 reverse gyrase [Nanobdella aerobiophila]